MTGVNSGSDKMKCTGLKMTSISPIQYFYTAAAGGMRSSNFIGDIALKYAFIRQSGLFNLPELDKFKPTYTELNNFKFWLTPAISSKMALGHGSDTVFLKNMVRNTMQGIDYNGSNMHPSFKSGQLMYKNFFFTQSIKPGNVFYSYLLMDEGVTDFKIPEAVRVGNNRTGLLKIEKTKEDFLAVVNLYTITKILGKKLLLYKNEYSSHLILQYYLKGYYNKSEVIEVYDS